MPDGYAQHKVTRRHALELHCLQLARDLFASRFVLGECSHGERNTARSVAGRITLLTPDRAAADSLERFGTMLPFRDSDGLAEVPLPMGHS